MLHRTQVLPRLICLHVLFLIKALPCIFSPVLGLLQIMGSFSTGLTETPLCIREVYDLWYFLLVTTMSYDAEIMTRLEREHNSQLCMLAEQF